MRTKPISYPEIIADPPNTKARTTIQSQLLIYICPPSSVPLYWLHFQRCLFLTISFSSIRDYSFQWHIGSWDTKQFAYDLSSLFVDNLRHTSSASLLVVKQTSAITRKSGNFMLSNETNFCELLIIHQTKSPKCLLNVSAS